MLLLLLALLLLDLLDNETESRAAMAGPCGLTTRTYASMCQGHTKVMELFGGQTLHRSLTHTFHARRYDTTLGRARQSFESGAGGRGVPGDQIEKAQ